MADATTAISLFLLKLNSLMTNDLAKLHRELGARKQTEEITNLRNEIAEKLHTQMREHFLSLLEIGGAVGYDRLKTEMNKAMELLHMLEGKSV